MNKTQSVFRDKEKLFTGTPNECFAYILANQGQSVHHATTYEGWSIMTETQSATEKRAFRMLQEIYLKQQNEEVTEKNIEEFGLCEENMELIHKGENAFIILYGEMGVPAYCNIIRRVDGELIETVELA